MFAECRLTSREKPLHYAPTADVEASLASAASQASLQHVPPDDRASLNATVALGKTAQLTCRHRGISNTNRTVRYTYTRLNRSIHGAPDWSPSNRARHIKASRFAIRAVVETETTAAIFQLFFRLSTKEASPSV